MQCTDKTIKELLPAYLEEGFDRTEKRKIESHLESCEDCRIELSLLRMISKESVPDPGEAFWADMPDRIYREVRRRKEKESFALRDLLDGVLIRRWVWATAAACTVAIISWFLVRPAPVDIARTVIGENRTAYDHTVPVEPVNPAELSSAELDAATHWARNEFAPINKAVEEERMENNNERDISEDLSDLTPRELDRVLEMLNKKEQELRNKFKKKTEEKRIG